jgi:hypothetical protein
MGMKKIQRKFLKGEQLSVKEQWKLVNSIARSINRVMEKVIVPAFDGMFEALKKGAEYLADLLNEAEEKKKEKDDET